MNQRVPCPLRWRKSDYFIILLQLYFMLMNLTVERAYCVDAITSTSTGFLLPETFEFCKQHNPLFLARPEWLRIATCISAFGFLPWYFLTLLTFLGGIEWMRLPLLVFVGVKLYAIVFYHFMEFTSDTPPNPGPYFLAEGPYVVSLVWIIWRFRSRYPFSTSEDVYWAKSQTPSANKIHAL